MAFFQQLSCWDILCPHTKNNFPLANFTSLPGVQEPGRIFCSSAIILCFRYKYSITGVNLMVRIMTTVPQVFIHGALKRLNSKGIKCNSIPKHEIFAVGTKCICPSFHEIPVPYWEGRLSKGSRSDSIFILEQMA